MKTGNVLETLPFVEAYSGPYVDSTHELSACVVSAGGDVLHAFGDVDRAYPIHSLLNPFLALEFVRSGAADAYASDDIEIAMAAGSHDGEERHVAAVRAFLASLEITEESLLCGPKIEGNIIVGPAPANRCSGEHAAILAMCRHLSLSTENYNDPEHPLNRRLLPILMATFGRDRNDTPLAIDSCGMPMFAASLQQIAAAYARFSMTDDLAAIRVRTAMTSEPAYMGGWFGNLDTCINTWSSGAVIGRTAMEGLHADAIAAQAVGVAIKIHDGSQRPVAPAVAKILDVINAPVTSVQLEDLADLSARNAAGVRTADLRVSGITS